MKPIVHIYQTTDPERFHFVAMPISGGSFREENLTRDELKGRLSAGPQASTATCGSGLPLVRYAHEAVKQNRGVSGPFSAPSLRSRTPTRRYRR